MNNTFTRIIPFLVLYILSVSRGAELKPARTSAPTNTPPSESSLTANSVDETQNRFPAILQDIKLILTEVQIADFHHDSLEAAYNLSRIYELLMEADQLGDMSIEDKEEFTRFDKTFTDIISNKLITVTLSDAPFSADRVRSELTSKIDPLEIEMGDSKFIVVDDRDGHIPLVRNKQVDQFIDYFTKKGRKQFEIWMERYLQYKDLILPILKAREIPEEIIVLAMIESGLNPKAYSRANASGMWQFVYSTGKSYGLDRNWYIDERRDPVKATHAACNFLLDLNESFDNWYLTLAAYNAGGGRVRRATRIHQTFDFWQLHSLPRETRNYIPYFLAAAIIVASPEEFGFEVPKVKPFRYEEVQLEKSADLAVLAHTAGIKVKTIREYNPELRQSASPADGPYLLKLPYGTKAKFVTNWSDLSDNERFAPQFVSHRVKYGESLWTISRKYNVSVHDIASVNKIKNRHKIRVGSRLKIPAKGGRLYGSSHNGGPPGHYKMVYTVRRGDTLGQIADDHRTQAGKIRRWNNLKYGSYIIHPGQKLTIWVKEG